MEREGKLTLRHGFDSEKKDHLDFETILETPAKQRQVARQTKWLFLGNADPVISQGFNLLHTGPLQDADLSSELG